MKSKPERSIFAWKVIAHRNRLRWDSRVQSVVELNDALHQKRTADKTPFAKWLCSWTGSWSLLSETWEWSFKWLLLRWFGYFESRLKVTVSILSGSDVPVYYIFLTSIPTCNVCKYSNGTAPLMDPFPWGVRSCFKVVKRGRALCQRSIHLPDPPNLNGRPENYGLTESLRPLPWSLTLSAFHTQRLQRPPVGLYSMRTRFI